MITQSPDTHPEAEKVQISLLQKLMDSQKVRFEAFLTK